MSGDYHVMSSGDTVVEFDEVFTHLSGLDGALIRVEDELNRGRDVTVHPTERCDDTSCGRGPA